MMTSGRLRGCEGESAGQINARNAEGRAASVWTPSRNSQMGHKHPKCTGWTWNLGVEVVKRARTEEGDQN